MDFAAQLAAIQAQVQSAIKKASTSQPSCDMTPVSAAQNALDSARATYLQCLPGGPQRMSVATQSINDQLSAYARETDQLNYISNFLIGHSKSDPNGGQIDIIKSLIQTSLKDLQKQQEELKAEIRKEQRIFTDSNVQESPAVAGMYFTKVPDNKILIAFMTCFGAFLLFAGLLIIYDKLPIYYFQAMIPAQRWTTVGLIWAVSLIFTYVFFFAFT